MNPLSRFSSALALPVAVLSFSVATAQDAARSGPPSLPISVGGARVVAPVPAPAGPSTTRGRGGPDAYGYSWIDSDEPGGPAFVWNDIAASGTPLTLGDNAVVGIAFPFVFPFYDFMAPGVNITSNGLFGGGGSTAFSNTPMPSPALPNNMIAAFWDDLDPSAGGTVHYSGTAEMFTVQFTDVPRKDDPASRMTFQIVYYPNGDFVMYYHTMTGVTDSATIGVENINGTIGLQVAYNEPYVHDSLAIRFGLDVTGVEEGPASAVRLEQNAPNPAAAGTRIAYALTEAMEVRLDVFDLTSRHVATLVDGWRSAGTHEVTWNASAATNGVYVYRLRGGDVVESRRLVVAR